MSDLDGGIPETTFYQSDIGPVQTGVVCQVLLGDPLLGTLISYHFRERGRQASATHGGQKPVALRR